MTLFGFPIFDPTIHIGDAVILVLAVPVFRAVRRFVRFVDILVEFPPHRHFNGSVLYPKGYGPGEVGSLKAVD